MASQPSVTDLLVDYARGDRDAFDRLIPQVYEELRVMARRERFRWRGFDAPGTESLVHEAYAKLVDQTRVDWSSRAQFFCLAATAMRSILVDNARARKRQKRGGDRRRVDLNEDLIAAEQADEELLSLDRALDALADRDARLARIVECRFFGGLTIEETAEAMEISPATVKRGWSTARSWLFDRIREDALEHTSRADG